MQTQRIQENLQSTVDNLGHTVEQAKANAGEGFGGLRQQFEQRPLLMFGAAVAAGYALGSIGGGDSDRSSSSYAASHYRVTNEHIDKAREYLRSSPAYDTSYNAMSAPASTPQSNWPSSVQQPGSFQHPSGVYQPTSSNQRSSDSDQQPSGSYHQPSGSYQPTSGQQSSGSYQPASSHKQTSSSEQPLGGLLGPLSGEFDSIKMAAVTTIRNFLRDTVREAVPSMRERVDELDRRSGRTPPSDKGLVDPNEGRDYVKTYHPSK